MRQYQAEFHKTKIIEAILINVTDKSISKIEVQNNENYLQKFLDFYKYYIVGVSGSNDYLFVSRDDDSKTKKSFTIEGDSFCYHGNAVVVKIPKSNNYQKLMKTNMSVEAIEKIISFD
ncbi:hypothetical protein [Lacinutrix sp. MEBiC02595]